MSDPFARLTATDSSAGPYDVADVLRLMHEAGMCAAAWRVEAALEELEELRAYADDSMTNEDHDAAVKSIDDQHSADVAKLDAEIDGLKADARAADDVMETEGTAEAYQLVRDLQRQQEAHYTLYEARCNEVTALKAELAKLKGPAPKRTRRKAAP